MPDSEYPLWRTEPRQADEKFVATGSALWFGAKILDYWRWAYSDLNNNTVRGRLAEFIVARSIGALDEVANEWGPYDLKTSSGLKIEVKTSAYLQSWYQEKLSKIVFGISQTLPWDRETNEYRGAKGRHSDVYVFCLLREQDRLKLNPLDLSQWEFYVAARSEIDQRFSTQKTVSLSRLRSFCEPVLVDALQEAIQRIIA